MWKYPWRYTEGWVVCAGLFTTGLALQFAGGKTDTEILCYPVNLSTGILFLFFLIVFHAASRKYPVLKWFSSVEASVTSTVSLLVLVIVMGLVRQVSPSVALVSNHIFDKIGFAQMTSSWSFALLFCYFLVVLGLTTIRKISRFKRKDTGFVLNHAGLFIALLSAVLGNGDLQRLKMYTSKGVPEWRALNEKEEPVELPLAIELESFTIDEYPPKLMILDNATGNALPEKQPVNYSVEASPGKASLLDWDIEVTAFLPSAAAMITKDTIIYKEYHSEGAVSALYVKARNRSGGAKREGWISCGNFMFPYVSLRLNDEVSLIMPEREPRRYASDITVYTKNNTVKKAVIEVNKSLSVAGWKIYQLSYDETKGKWSDTSVFELVRDPWLPAVYTGIFMMLAGSVCLFVFAPKKQLRNNVRHQAINNYE